MGGDREPLESHAMYDSINHAGGLAWIDEGVGYYMVTSRRDATAVALNPKVFSNNYNPNLRVGGFGAPYPMKPLQVDAPEHLTWRYLLAPPFSPVAVRTWEGRIRDRANSLIDGLAGAGRCDFVSDFAHIFPTTIFLDFMGLPHSDLPRFLEWETAILHPGPDGTHMEMTREQAQAAVRDYFAELIAAKRAGSPAAGSSDLLTAAMSWEMDGKPISEDNLLSFCLLMFAAGLDTVTAELAYGMLHLATHDADRARIASDPSVIDDAVEELLRVYPIAMPPRVAVQDTEVRGCPVKAGDLVVLGLAGVGRNEADHDRATEVDFDRERLPNTTFGIGPHRCAGAHLARLELKVAYQEWHRRIPDYRLAEGVKFTEGGNLTLGLNSLPLEWDAPTATGQARQAHRA
jgi:cytochrome P450